MALLIRKGRRWKKRLLQMECDSASQTLRGAAFELHKIVASLLAPARLVGSICPNR